MNTKPFDVGRLRSRVRVEKRCLGPANELGERSEKWEPFGMLPRAAEVLPITAKERMRSDSDVVADVSHIVTMRWFCGLTSTDHRLIYKGRILNIVGVVNVKNLSRWWEVTCSEIGEVVVTAGGVS